MWKTAALLSTLIALWDAMRVEGATVRTLDAAQFVAATGGKRVPGMPDVPPNALWVVRFCMPWEAASAPRAAAAQQDLSSDAEAFLSAANEVPEAVAYFGEVVIQTPAELAVADAAMATKLPVISAYNSKYARADVPRGHVFSARTLSLPVVFKGTVDTPSLTAFVYENVPPLYLDPLTDALYPTLTVVRSEDELVASIEAGNTNLTTTATPTEATRRAALAHEVKGLLVVVPDLATPRDTATLQTYAAAASAGAVTRGRGGMRLFVADADAFPAWGPTETGTFRLVPVKTAPSGSTLDKLAAAGASSVLRVGDLDTILHTASRLADSIETQDAFEAAIEAAVVAARNGAAKLLAPSTRTSHPLRRLDTQAQFVKHVAELRSGVAVVFFVRESDPLYGTHLRAAREVAESSLKDTSATLPDGSKTQMKFEVFLVDAEVHKEAANAVRVPQVPTVAFFLELRQMEGKKKGLRFLPQGRDFSSKVISKFMRTQIFDGKETVDIDARAVPFAATVPPSTLDLTMQTSYFDTDPRRIGPGAPDSLPKSYMSLLRATVQRDREAAKQRGSKPSGKSGKKKSDNSKHETPEQLAKREAREAKAKQRDEEKKAQIKAELEARAAAKKAKIDDRKRQEEERQAKRASDVAAKKAAAAERRAREEQDGTAAKRRAAAKAKKARAARLEKMRKSKLASKAPKDRAALSKLWADDGKTAAQQYVVVADDDTASTGAKNVRLLDHIL